jgi:hypothetical protein
MVKMEILVKSHKQEGQHHRERRRESLGRYDHCAKPEDYLTIAYPIETDIQARHKSKAMRIIATACHFIFFFADRASGERWVATHPQTTLLPLEDVFAFSKRQNARPFGREPVTGE